MAEEDTVKLSPHMAGCAQHTTVHHLVQTTLNAVAYPFRRKLGTRLRVLLEEPDRVPNSNANAMTQPPGVLGVPLIFKYNDSMKLFKETDDTCLDGPRRSEIA
jgi:hypothetical protein